MKRTRSNHRALFAIPLAALAIAAPVLLSSVAGANTANAAPPKASAAAITSTITDGPPWG